MKKSNFWESLLRGRRGHVLASLLFGGGLLLGSAKAASHPVPELRHESGAHLLEAWRQMLVQAMPLSQAEQLEAVNQFFNREVRYAEDHKLWGQFDYWASPVEMLEAGAGDCEDFALAKYFTLRLLGVPEDSLRLMYTKVTSTQQAHMVLGYWPGHGEVPLVLDNLSPEIRPLSERHDLEMQFAFDAGHLYRYDHSRLIMAGDARLLPHWPGLLSRARSEVLNLARSAQQPAKPAG